MNSLKLLSVKNVFSNPIIRSLPIFPSNFTQLFNFSFMNSKKFSVFNNCNKPIHNLNLTPLNFVSIPSRGFKVKGKLKRRCKDCYYARIDGRMMILCDSYPRHKQLAQVPRKKYTWILTHCTQSKKRPY